MDLLSEDAIGINVTSLEVDADIKNLSYFAKIIQLTSHRIGDLIKYKGTQIEIDGSDFNSVNFNMTIDNKLTLYYRGYNTLKDHFSKS